MSIFLVALFLHSLLSSAQSLPNPIQITTSSQVYGPDGPWQAVSVSLGDPNQVLDLYPGGLWQSTILTTQLCQDDRTSSCGAGGLFDPASSDTIDSTSIIGPIPNISGIDSQWTNGATRFSYNGGNTIRDRLQIDTFTVPDFDIRIYENITMVYPDGNYPLQVGKLSLGPLINHSHALVDISKPLINSSLIPGELAAQNIIPSNSFGLHIGIGTEALRLKLSLWLGGYDASRIVGTVSNQSTVNSTFAIDLLDIGIKVDNGGSPFTYSAQPGLLRNGNSSVSSAGISVVMNPNAPYLYLPNSTCAAIAKNLPVKYNSGKALYIWDISDPQYVKIVTSPTYLSFVFRGSSGNLTINVPFQLLNLTLQAPLMSISTPYFPCQPPQGQEDSYSLRRAFLQAAFIGVNWNSSGESQWFLAQAPGPNTDTNPQSRSSTDSVPVGIGKEWADTWNGFWTALPASETSANPAPNQSTPPEHSSASLSGGAIAGIAIGGASAAIVVGIAILLFRRRIRKRLKTKQATSQNKSDTQFPPYPLPPEFPGTGIRTELESRDTIHGMPFPTSELPSHTPPELPSH